MKKPKWRKYKGGWKRGVLEVAVGWDGFCGVRADRAWLAYYRTPEAAMKAADKWWERTRKKMEGK